MGIILGKFLEWANRQRPLDASLAWTGVLHTVSFYCCTYKNAGTIRFRFNAKCNNLTFL